MPKKILLVFAHPDDECFTVATTVAKYTREEDTQVALLCATRGEAGSPGQPPLCTQEELPAVREAELRLAANILGIQPVILLPYHDKHLSDISAEELSRHIAETIREIQPQVVITFPPHGISGHPDHKAISRSTMLAVESLAGEAPYLQKLYHVVIPADGGTHAPPRLHTDPQESITTIISAPAYATIVRDALAAHRTQHQSVERVFPGVLSGNLEHVRTENHYILVWKREGVQTSRQETDLFAGVTV